MHSFGLACWNNELWNLVPADAHFNTQIKRDRLPSPERLARAVPHLVRAYTNYGAAPALAQSLRDDVLLRFTTVRSSAQPFPETVARLAARYIEQVAEARNLARFE